MWPACKGAANEADKPSLLLINTEVELLLEHVLSQPSVLKNIVSKLEKMKGSIVQAISQMDEIFAQQSWSSLFTLMRAQATSEKSLDDLKVTTEFGQLTSFWQKRLMEQCLLKTQANAHMRADKTLALEVLAQVESPAELAAQRMVVQVSMMQEQMQSTDNIDLQQSLVDWLRLGQLEVSDFALLTRLKKIFIS